MSEFVVLDENGRFLGFGPRTWATEYPDARTFETKQKAVAAARVAKVLCEVVEDYGLETQRTVETIG